MVQYLAGFLEGLSDMLQPLRELTKKDTPFAWSTKCEDAFQAVKDKISSTPVLRFYDPSKELELQVDSSRDGLGACLMQEGQPIEYASRSLTETQRKWAQIEKEMLAVVFGLERFDQYTYGRETFVTTDHKPLETIVKKPLSDTPRRLQQLMMRASRYHFSLKWAKGSTLLIADTLSRAYIQCLSTKEIVNEPRHHVPDTTIQRVKEELRKDESLQQLKEYILKGFPEEKAKVPNNIKPYFDERHSLTIEDDLIVKGQQILIPQAMRKEIKEKLHAAHLSTDSMLRRARRVVYWPGMSSDIRQVAESCSACQTSGPRNQKETLIQHPRGEKPWEKVGTDLFQIKGRNYMVLVDYLTNYIEVDYLPNITTQNVISKLKSHFARYGIPKSLVSDCGTQYMAAEFTNFLDKWGISHVTSAPGHHQANGKAEAAVKIMKNLMTRCVEAGEDQYEALLELRNTPKQDGKSPAEMLFSYEPRTLIPSTRTQNQAFDNHAKRRDDTIKRHSDKHATDLTPMNNNQPVYYQNPDKPGWHPGWVDQRISYRSYKICGNNGGKYVRNRRHLKRRLEPVTNRQPDSRMD